MDEPHIASFGAGVMSRMTGIQRDVGPRIWEARVLRLNGTDATAGVRRDAKVEVRGEKYGRCGNVQRR